MISPENAGRKRHRWLVVLDETGPFILLVALLLLLGLVGMLVGALTAPGPLGARLLMFGKGFALLLGVEVSGLLAIALAVWLTPHLDLD